MIRCAPAPADDVLRARERERLPNEGSAQKSSRVMRRGYPRRRQVTADDAVVLYEKDGPDPALPRVGAGEDESASARMALTDETKNGKTKPKARKHAAQALLGHRPAPVVFERTPSRAAEAAIRYETMMCGDASVDQALSPCRWWCVRSPHRIRKGEANMETRDAVWRMVAANIYRRGVLRCAVDDAHA